MPVCVESETTFEKDCFFVIFCDSCYYAYRFIIIIISIAFDRVQYGSLQKNTTTRVEQTDNPNTALRRTRLFYNLAPTKYTYNTKRKERKTMWGTSFNDLAKKAAEMQEQAAASMVRILYYGQTILHFLLIRLLGFSFGVTLLDCFLNPTLCHHQ